MMRLRLRPLALALLVLFGTAALAIGDTLVLKDGTKIVGSVMQAGDRLWIEPDNGAKAHFVDSTDIKQWIKGTTTPAAGSSPGTPAAPAGGGVLFKAAKAKTDAVIYPADAIKIWKTFLAATPAPSAADKTLAQAEVDAMQKLQDAGSERVLGKWVSGVERKKMATDARDVFTEALDLLKADKTLQAIPKLQEALKIYPNYYYANSFMANITFSQDNAAESMKYVQMCLKLRPTSLDALNNYAVLMASQKQYDIAVTNFYSAIQIADDEILATNLAKVLMADPDKSSALIVKVTQASKLLNTKYDIPANIPATTWARIPYEMHPPVDPSQAGEGMLISGSGFVLNDQGYVLTNRHVVLKMTSFLVITADGKSLPAEVVTIDKDRDLALLKIKKLDPGIKLTPVNISKMNYPDQGQQCYAVGYPLMDVLGATLKITQGIISGKASAENGVDVLVDAKVNPGNSGGPLLDKYGQVIGIVTMKTLSDTSEDSYGMAISGGTIKKFLDENKIKVASEDADTALEPQDVVKKVRGGTVCILAH